ncbi:MAG TPA: hypothetical protein VIY54_00790 [Steroidobacteraceae bacterium]
MTETLVETTALVPPAPAQVNENTVGAVSAAELRVPLLASEPLQPPEAAQEVAFVELHVSVVAVPVETVVGLADKVAVGTMLTVTVAVLLTPLEPLHTSE